MTDLSAVYLKVADQHRETIDYSRKQVASHPGSDHR